jgi:UDP-2,3-diacylglucosamine pyrophosphatase LpxH
MRLRSVFVSDVHLGSKGCRADLLLEFLKSVEVENLYLVGDIFDLWAMRKGFFWPQEHNNVVRTILGKAKGGTRVIYIPGNHDEELREFCGSVFGNLEIHREYVHAPRTVASCW